MALGSGWELTQTAEFDERYDSLVLGDMWLEDQLEVLYIGLLRGPDDPPFAEHLIGGYWSAVMPGPPQLVVFYTVDEDLQVITLETLLVALDPI